MQYKLIINNGQRHTSSEIVRGVNELQKAVQHCKAVGHTVVEVLVRDKRLEQAGFGWKVT